MSHHGRHRADDKSPAAGGGLVQPEGVDAGSEKVLAEPQDGTPGRDVVSGGDAGAAPAPQEASEQHDVTGAPSDDEREPDQRHGTGGQDAGSAS